MNSIDTRDLASRLRTIESVAVISRVVSTNLIARRVVDECVENELQLPSVVIVAREQIEGRGRMSRSWHSPRDKGIWITAIHSRGTSEIGLLPLEVGSVVADFLRETYGLDAKLKWPNDVVIDGRKVAGILIEARQREDDSTGLIIGIGINVDPVGGNVPAAISISEAADRDIDLDAATVAFIERLDARLAEPMDRAAVIARWRELSAHRAGDRVTCALPAGTVSGEWRGIDDEGRALINDGTTEIAVSAGDIIAQTATDG
jgi:BirA family transcriptional regulator, biotin operon repressor / biotin---[acetyl-CoA-carboxylase] ligase